MQFEEVKELISIFEKTDLNDMEVHIGDAIVHLNRSDTATVVKTNSMDSSLDQLKEVNLPQQEKGKYIKAPIVGTFYQSASPDKPPFVNIGDKVLQDDVVCIIESMKCMNEITSKETGEITEILVENGDFVEFGTPLFKVG